MTSFVALLRAVNVGGTGKLPMTDLKTMCEAAGFRSVRTYIASGNVVFESELTAPRVKKELEDRLLASDFAAMSELMASGAILDAAGPVVGLGD